MRDKQKDSALSFDPILTGNKMTSPDPGLIDFGEDYLLHVECGPNQAKLYLNRLKMGSRGACVVFNNAWLTPNQFQAVSGRKTAKDWKRSIKHFGKSLKLLLAKGTLTIDPAECRCENCSGDIQGAPELVTQLSVGSDEENVPPIKVVHKSDTPLSPRITSPAPGDISAGPENGGAASEILGTECHPGRDKRLPPTWNVLSTQEAGSLRELDEKQGGCGSSTQETFGGDKSGPDGGSTHAINGKSSTHLGSEVSFFGIHDRASLNYSPAATSKAGSTRPCPSESPRRESGLRSDVYICHNSSSAEKPPRDTTSGDVTHHVDARSALCPESELHTPLCNRELNKKKSPNKKARLTSIIDSLKKNKQEGGERRSDSEESDKLLIDTSHRSSSISPLSDARNPLELPVSTTLSPYTGALSLALLSNPLYLQSIYPYGIPKEMTAMLNCQHLKNGFDPRFLPSSPFFPTGSKKSSSHKRDRKRKHGDSGSRSKSLPTPVASAREDGNLTRCSSEHLKYDKDGALDLSIEKENPVSKDRDDSHNKRFRFDNTLHYYPSNLRPSPTEREDPLQSLERLQHLPHH